MLTLLSDQAAYSIHAQASCHGCLKSRCAIFNRARGEERREGLYWDRAVCAMYSTNDTFALRVPAAYYMKHSTLCIDIDILLSSRRPLLHCRWGMMMIVSQPNTINPAVWPVDYS